LEEEEYKAFLEREVGEDLRDLVTVDANAESGGLGEREGTTKIGEDDKVKQSKKKKKKGKKEREIERDDKKEREEGKSKQVAKKVNQKSKEEADHEFLMQYVLFILLSISDPLSSVCPVLPEVLRLLGQALAVASLQRHHP
jgi:protein KRI1